jgi:hypothetical protein
LSTVRHALFAATIHMTYLECEKKAKDFLDHWEQIKKGHDHEKLTGKE